MNNNNPYENEPTLKNDEILTFMNEVITGIELKIYNQLIEDEKLSMITTTDVMYMGINYLEIYLSVIYKGLIEHTDPLICEKISSFSKSYGIEDKFMLNIITNTLMKSYPKFPRSKLSTESKDAYLTSVQDILTTMSKYVRFAFTSDMEKLLKVYNN
jgi:hypothetical protein